jgi:phosphatidylinositol alpha-1,6-mannosyltransferase
LGISDSAHLFVFPGDLEVSGGAEAVAAAVEPVVRELPDAVFVFACRYKTAAAPLIAQALSRRLGEQHSRFAPAPSDVLALIAGATAVLFPVDDLCGKVDLPVVLLEAMSLGVPVVAIDHGPLRDLEGALLIPPHDHQALVRAALDLARSPELGPRVAREQREAVKRRFHAAVVASRYERLYQELIPSAAAG